MKVIKSMKTLVALSALLLIAGTAAHPIFCDRFEADSCAQLPQIFIEMDDIEAFDSGQLLIRLEKGALGGSQEVFLTSSDPGILDVPSSIRIAEGQDKRLVPVEAGAGYGEVTIEATSVDHRPAAQPVQITPRVLALLAGDRIEVGHSIEGFVDLERPAPAGGAAIQINSSDAGAVSISPASVTVPEGRTRVSITLSAQTAGPAEITVSAPGYADSTLAATSLPSMINLGLAPDLLSGQQRSLPLSLSAPAPPGGLEIRFESSDPTVAEVDETIFIAEGGQYPSRNPQLRALSTGNALITASAVGFAPIQRPVAVRDYGLQFNLRRSELSPGWTDLVEAELSAPAPPGGLQVSLRSSNSGIFAAPPSFTIPAGSTQAEFELQGVAEGSALLTASGEGVEETVLEIMVGELPRIHLWHVGVGKDLQLRRHAKLSRRPPKPVDLTITVDDPSIALVSASADEVGAASVIFKSDDDGSVFVQGLRTGSTFFTASAPGFRDRRAKLTVSESGFYFSSSSTARSDLDRSFTVSLRVASLSDNGFDEEEQMLRGGLEIEIPVFNSDASVGVVRDNPAVFTGGQSDRSSVRFEPQAYGETTLSFTQPQGFTTPTGRATTLDVTIGRLLYTRDATIGQSLVSERRPTFSSSLRPRNLYLEVADPAIATISTDRQSPGENSIELRYSLDDYQDYGYYLHGLEVGTTELIVSSPGLETTTSTITVTESGLYFDTRSNPLAITLSSVPFDLPIAGAFVGPDGELQSGFDLRPGVEPLVSLVNDEVAIGDFLENPVALDEEGDIVARFQPLALGSSRIDLDQPPGFSAQDGYPTELAIEVVPTDLQLMGSWIVGKDLQATYRVQLGSEATGPADILIRVDDPDKASLSTDPNEPGSASILIEGVERLHSSLFYVSGLDVGDTEIVATIVGMDEVRRSIEVSPSAFVFDRPAAINTTTAHRFRIPIHLGATPLSDKLSAYAFQGIRPGLSLEVPVVIADPDVGQIFGSPRLFQGSFQPIRSVDFDPTGPGMSTISLSQPAGFSTPPAAATTIEVAVGLPRIDVGDVFVGDKLQTRRRISIDRWPSEPIDLILSVDDPSLARLSTDRNEEGSQQITIEGFGPGPAEYFYVQGFEQGETTIVASAPGYDDEVATVSVGTSAFTISGSNPLVTTPNSQPVEYVVSARMSAGGRSGTQELRAGLSVEVPITNSDKLVGTVTPQQLAFEGGADTSKAFEFAPERVGTTTLSLVPPAGFLQTQASREVVVNGSCFERESLSETAVGKDLQTSRWIGLRNRPVSPVVVDIAVANPSVARVSAAASLPGSGSASLTLDSDTTSGRFYIEGISKGSTTIQLMATGCEPITGEVTVVDAGAFLGWPYWIATDLQSAPVPLTVNLAAVTADGELRATQGVRPGRTVEVPIAVEDPSVGVLSEDTVVFQGGQSSGGSIEFSPAAIGQTSISVMQPAGFFAPAYSITTIPVNVLAGRISLSDVLLGEHLQSSHEVRLRATPTAPLDLTLTVDDPSVALLSDQSTAAGAGALVFEAVATDDEQAFYVQGVDEGVTTLTASAPGFTPVSSTITVTPSGFYIDWPRAIETTTMSDAQSVRVEVGRLRPGASGLQRGQIRAGLSVTVPIELADPGLGTLLDTPLVFEGGDTSFHIVRFRPESPGASSIVLTQPAGFTAPENESVSIPVEVRTPEIRGLDDLFIGQDLQDERRIRLSVEPPEPVDVVLSVANPEIAALSAGRDDEGSQTLTLTDVSQSWSGSTVWIQGLSRGRTTLTASAPGYEPIETTLTVTGSGFFINRDSPIVTTTYSSPTGLGVQSARLDGLGRFADAQGLRPGREAVIPVMNSDPGVGEISDDTLLFTSASGVEESTILVPAAVGRTTVSISQPEGFTKPFDRNDSVDVDVVAPSIEVDDFVIGENLQAGHRFRLQERPPEPVEFEVVVSDPSIALLSSDRAEPGSASVTLDDVFGFSVYGLYIHGVEEGVTTITINAPGYAPAEALIEVVESGFEISWPGSVTTTPISVPSPVSIRVDQSIPPTHHWSDPELRAGLSVAVPVAVEDPAVGQMRDAAVIFEGGAGLSALTDFIPDALGSSRITLTQPPGFVDLPNRTQSIPVTVESPEIFVSPLSAGIHLQSWESVRLSDVPATPVNVRIAIEDTAIAILSKSREAVGAASQTFHDVATNGNLYFYLQGLQRGSTSLTVSAPGFDTIEVPVSVTNAGFFIDWPSAVSTRVGLSPTPVNVRSIQLSDTGLAMEEQGLRAAMVVTVPISSDNPQIGTITTSPLVFTGGQAPGFRVTEFRPTAAGNTTIRLTQPPGFNDPSVLNIAIPAEVRD